MYDKWVSELQRKEICLKSFLTFIVHSRQLTKNCDFFLYEYSFWFMMLDYKQLGNIVNFKSLSGLKKWGTAPYWSLRQSKASLERLTNS